MHASSENNVVGNVSLKKDSYFLFFTCTLLSGEYSVVPGDELTVDRQRHCHDKDLNPDLLWCQSDLIVLTECTKRSIIKQK